MPPRLPVARKSAASSDVGYARREATPKMSMAAEAFDPKLLSEKHVTEQGGKVMDGQATLVRIPELEGRLLQVPRSEIIPNPNQPREYFDENELKKLKKSIEEVGLRHAVACVPVKLANGEIKLFIVDGERRFRASEYFPTIKTEVVWTANKKDLLYESAILNEARADLNPIERGKYYKELIEMEMEIEKISKSVAILNVAEKLSVSDAKIKNHLLLLNLPHEIRKLIIIGKLPTSSALCLKQAKAEFGDKIDLVRIARTLIDNPDADFDNLEDISPERITMTNARAAVRKDLMRGGHDEAAAKVAASAPIFTVQAAASRLENSVHKLLNVPRIQNIKFLRARSSRSLEEFREKLVAARKSINFVLEDLVEPARGANHESDKDEPDESEEGFGSASVIPPERPKRAPAKRTEAQEKLAKALDSQQPLSAVKVTSLKTDTDRAAAVKKLLDRRTSPPPPSPAPKPTPIAPPAPLPAPSRPQKKGVILIPSDQEKALGEIPNDVFVIHPRHWAENAGIRDNKFKIMPTNDPRYRDCIERYDATRSDIILTDERNRVVCVPRNAIISLREYERQRLGRHVG